MAQGFEFAMQSALLVGLQQHQRCIIFVCFGVISGAENCAEMAIVLQFIPPLLDLVRANDHRNVIALTKTFCNARVERFDGVLQDLALFVHLHPSPRIVHVVRPPLRRPSRLLHGV